MYKVGHDLKNTSQTVTHTQGRSIKLVIAETPKVFWVAAAITVSYVISSVIIFLLQ